MLYIICSFQQISHRRDGRTEMVVLCNSILTAFIACEAREHQQESKTDMCSSAFINYCLL